MYADYDFYLNIYYGNVIAEEDFPRLSERASDYVRAETGGISDRMDGDGLKAVKKASCAVAEALLDEEILLAGVYSGGTAVSSETVGGWSRSYRAASMSSADTASIDRRKRDALLLYLGNLPAFAPLFMVRSCSCIHRAV